MTCLAEDTILAFVEGRLAPAAIEAVEAHTRNCSDCRDLLSAAVAVAAPGRPDTVAVAAGRPGDQRSSAGDLHAGLRSGQSLDRPHPQQPR